METRKEVVRNLHRSVTAMHRWWQKNWQTVSESEERIFLAELCALSDLLRVANPIGAQEGR